MAAQQVVLCDSNIIIKLFQGDLNIKRIFDKIGENHIACSVITYSEIIYGTKKANLPAVKKYFGSILVLPLTETISNAFIGLSLNYSYSHHIKIPDALIAATAIVYGIPLFTENKKDFDFIRELKFYKP
ncbi:MAG: type II toxin-antitoxin system VapC family toxin [Bacteroidia bacterium]